MDAFSLLKEDHKRVKAKLVELEATTERAIETRTQGLEELTQMLVVHEAVEEEVFYPALKKHAETKAIVLEGYEEHDVVDMILREVQETPVDSELWAAKFKVMKENLEHHIEEEEGEMFKDAAEVLDEEALEDLGRRMEERKGEFQAA